MKNNTDVKEFWNKFVKFMREKGLDEKKARRYSDLAQKFAMSMPGRLVERKAKDVRAFIDNITKIDASTGTEARVALAFFYRDFLKIDLRKKFKHTKTDDLNRDMIKNEKDLNDKFKKLFENFISIMREKHYSIRTEQTYLSWLKRYISFHNMKPPELVGAQGVKEYLNYLAETREVSASTQNQALNSIVFLYKHLLNIELSEFGDFSHAKRPKRVPTVLTKKEVMALLDEM
nr:site-specific integrase [Geobacteraceae bacterium]